MIYGWARVARYVIFNKPEIAQICGLFFLSGKNVRRHLHVT